MKTWMKELGLAMNITELGAKEDMFIKASGKLSVNIVDEGMLSEADYVGSLSGAKADKSKVFEYELGEASTPIVSKAPLTMECSVVDICNTPGFESFICTIDNTYVEEKYLNDAGKINYNTLKPVLFEFPTYAISLAEQEVRELETLADQANVSTIRGWEKEMK